jgi:dynein heavy chain 2
VKALGSTFGRQVLVFNCDEVSYSNIEMNKNRFDLFQGIDVKSIGRIFIGICKCGMSMKSF